jgi:hypothetical protein
MLVMYSILDDYCMACAHVATNVSLNEKNGAEKIRPKLLESNCEIKPVNMTILSAEYEG